LPRHETSVAFAPDGIERWLAVLQQCRSSDDQVAIRQEGWRTGVTVASSKHVITRYTNTNASKGRQMGEAAPQSRSGTDNKAGLLCLGRCQACHTHNAKKNQDGPQRQVMRTRRGENTGKLQGSRHANRHPKRRRAGGADMGVNAPIAGCIMAHCKAGLQQSTQPTKGVICERFGHW